MRGNGSNTRGNDNNTRGSGSQTRGKMEFRFSVRPDAVLKFLELLLADSSAHREVSDFADNVSSRSHFRIFGHGCAWPQMPKWNVRQPASTAGIRLAEGVCSSTALAPRSQGRPPRQQCTRTVPLRQSEVEETSASVQEETPPRQPERRRRPQQDGGASDWATFIGSVAESQEEHLKRHGGGLRSCPRCRWYLHGKSWLASYGGTSMQSAGPRCRVHWLQERPVRWGGTWALGCAFCAAAANCYSSTGKSPPAATRRMRLGSKWCRFEICPKTLQAEHVKQHRHYDVHKMAERAYLQPDKPLSLEMQASEEDDALLAGAVPQPTDWLRAWQAARCAQSWKAAAAHGVVENFAHQIRQRAATWRGLKAMAEVLQLVIRNQKRQWIRECNSISLTFDDRQGYKLILFRCDAPLRCAAAPAGTTAPARAATPTVWREGIVGCTDCLIGCTLNDLADDYALRTVEQIVKQVRAFCGDDEALYAKFTNSVRIVVADGALQKVAQYMRKTHFSSIVLITRDPAHMIRIAARDPLLRTGRFEAQHKRLFTDKHALFKELQYSELWQARLQDCQRIVLARPAVDADGNACAATQGGDLRHIMRHYAYAPQRFESWANPMRKYACTLNAVALLLADVAGDERQTKQRREMAQQCLDAMTPRDLWETGIVGDFGEIAMRCDARS